MAKVTFLGRERIGLNLWWRIRQWTILIPERCLVHLRWLPSMFPSFQSGKHHKSLLRLRHRALLPLLLLLFGLSLRCEEDQMGCRHETQGMMWHFGRWKSIMHMPSSWGCIKLPIILVCCCPWPHLVGEDQLLSALYHLQPSAWRKKLPFRNM